MTVALSVATYLLLESVMFNYYSMLRGVTLLFMFTLAIKFIIGNYSAAK